jgi:hypothetical protein
MLSAATKTLKMSIDLSLPLLIHANALLVAIVRPTWAALSDHTSVISARKAFCTPRTSRDTRRSTLHSNQRRIRFTVKSVVAITSRGFLVATICSGISASNIPPWSQLLSFSGTGTENHCLYIGLCFHPQPTAPCPASPWGTLLYTLQSGTLPDDDTTYSLITTHVSNDTPTKKGCTWHRLSFRLVNFFSSRIAAFVEFAAFPFN